MAHITRRGRGVCVGVTVLVMALPSAATAAEKPAVTTGGVANLGQSTVTLKGSVNPRGAATTYFFQLGLTRLYGVTTTPTALGGGTRARAVTADVVALAPATVYHYRLVAQNSEGITRGADRTFTTRRQPLGLVLAATPNPVPFGEPTVLSGNLSGTGNANQQVVLQTNPFPYTGGFVDASNVQVTNASGDFAFNLLSVPFNSQFRVQMPERPAVVSPIVTVGVAVKISTSAQPRRIRRGRRVRFSGEIRPARDGTAVYVQKLRRSGWSTVATTIARHSSDSASSFRKRVRLRRGGRFRVLAGIADGQFVPTAGTTVRIRVRR